MKWKEEKKKEKEEEEQERLRLAAEAAEAAKREKEEYEKWMGSFSIESGGAAAPIFHQNRIPVLNALPSQVLWTTRSRRRARCLRPPPPRPPF